MDKSYTSPNIRRNWGYWDGYNDAQSGRWPLWSKHTVYRCRHPHDKVYGEAYWMGRYGEAHPNNGMTPEQLKAAGLCR